jgi:hypothetical protein
MRFLPLLIGLLWMLPAGAQPVLVLEGNLPGGQLDIAPYTWFYEDRSGDTLPLPVIESKPFRPFAEKRNERATFSDRSRMVTWIRFTIRNAHPTDTLRLYHDAYAHNDITTYESGRPINRSGIGISGSVLPGSPRRRPIRFETALVIPPGANRTYYVRVIDYIVTVTPVTSQLFSVQRQLELNYETAVGLQTLMTIMCVLLGFLLFMSVYAAYSYLLTRDKAFLYYLCYTFMALLLSFHNVDSRFGLGWLYQHYTILNPYHPGWLYPGVLTIFYGLFIAHVIHLSALSPRTWRVLCGLFGVLALQEGLSVFESFYGRPLLGSNMPYQYGLVPASLTTLVLIGAVVRSRTPIRRYLLAGMLSLLLLTLTSLLINVNPVKVVKMSPEVEMIVNYVGIWIILGLSVEGLCFALALAYRGRLTELENQRMQGQYARDLEVQLGERTREIAEQAHHLETQRVRQLELAFEQRLAETEMGALRAQMNPHFIFNCLNSIKLYATENDSAKAAEYLTKFSRLIRLVLENSRSERVTLQNELDALRLYLEMEAMRFKDKLRFSVDVSPDVDTDFIEIPPLLIQPYVENAIWHGLMHKTEGGTVALRVEQPADNLLRVTITDDGVGRARAAQLKSKSAAPRKSFGMDVTSERITLINQLYKTHTRVQIHDLTDAAGEPAGTEVVLETTI